VDILFWICLGLVAYPYAIYPAALLLLNRLAGRKHHEGDSACEPTVSVILPVHNEAVRIAAKVANVLELDYPPRKLELIVIGDGCTDDTLERARAAGGATSQVLALPVRSGKAAALNLGVECAKGEVVVFTDASILLERRALRLLVGHFSDPAIGCVSGEDRIEGQSTEGLYGRLELMLRREEARLHSIAGASGCFYGQRRSLVESFVAGMAPDFLSVLVTVRAGHRAVAEPGASGTMAATAQRAEFARKVRTFLRGMTALAGSAGLLVPWRYPAFSFVLWSHKVMRWLAPVPLLGCLSLAWFLRHEPVFAVAWYVQLAAYALAVIGLAWPTLGARVALVRISAFFVLVNAAALQATLLWLTGTRVEVWQPTRRPT
jgi:hypothetical protein